jgi:hypothetical protein
MGELSSDLHTQEQTLSNRELNAINLQFAELYKNLRQVELFRTKGYQNCYTVPYLSKLHIAH